MGRPDTGGSQEFLVFSLGRAREVRAGAELAGQVQETEIADSVG